MKKVLTSFSSATWSELTSQSLDVETKLPLNPAFLNPIIPIADLTLSRIALQNAEQAAQDGGKSFTLAKNKAMVKLAGQLTREALWVNAVCAGDETLLVASGFTLQNTPQPAGIPTTPVSLVALANGYTGQVKVKFKGSKGASSFQVMASSTDPVAGATWVAVEVTTKRSATVANLKSNTDYWFAVIAVGTAGDSVMSAYVVAKAA